MLTDLAAALAKESQQGPRPPSWSTDVNCFNRRKPVAKHGVEMCQDTVREAFAKDFLDKTQLKCQRSNLS